MGPLRHARRLTAGPGGFIVGSMSWTGPILRLTLALCLALATPVSGFAAAATNGALGTAATTEATTTTAPTPTVATIMAPPIAATTVAVAAPPGKIAEHRSAETHGAAAPCPMGDCGDAPQTFTDCASTMACGAQLLAVLPPRTSLARRRGAMPAVTRDQAVQAFAITRDPPPPKSSI